MSNVKSFTVGTETYNVARATAVQQDEALSLLSDAMIQRLASAIEGKIEASTAIFTLLLGMRFDVKNKVDSLLLSRITRHGESNPITVRDFDGRVMEYNKLRTEVLMWNFESFFTFWANELNVAITQQPTQNQ